MRQSCTIVAIIVVTLLSFAQSVTGTKEKSSAELSESSYVPVHNFDSKRDAAADIQAAITEAQITDKRILLDVGGDWCPYCRQMDEFFREHQELRKLRDDNFITVAVFYSSENKNEKVLSRYPKVEGIPHFYVLETNGTLLHSQHVLDLRSHGSYDPEKMKEFLTTWSPRSPAKSAETTSVPADHDPPKRD